MNILEMGGRGIPVLGQMVAVPLLQPKSSLMRHAQGTGTPLLSWLLNLLTGGKSPKTIGDFNTKCVDARMIGPGKDLSGRMDMLGKLIQSKNNQGNLFSRCAEARHALALALPYDCRRKEVLDASVLIV